MDTNDIRTLKILEELDSDHAPSQRDLAKALGVSLGLVNSFVKRLVNKGYFKVTTIPKNRVRYVLTPKGAAEKTRLTYSYIGRSYHYYKDTRQKLRELFERIQGQGVKQIVIYGVNDFAEIAYISLLQTKIEFAGVVDDFKAGKIFMGNKVLEPSRLKDLHYDKVLLSSADKRETISRTLFEIGIPQEKILMLIQ